MSEMVALADSHGGVEVCLTTFLRPPPWVEDGARLLPKKDQVHKVFHNLGMHGIYIDSL